MAPVWRPMTAASLRAPDAALRGWLAEPGQLTCRLRKTCGGCTIAVEDQSERTLSGPDADLLGCAVQPALMREIVLQAATGEPCIFARTLVPRDTLRAHEWLGELGGMPLGAALALRTDVMRSGFEIARLEPGDELFLPAAGYAAVTPAGMWARRSVFQVGPGSSSLLVYEVFLPALDRYASPAGA